MSAHTTGTRDEWLKARKELLEDEKELTRQTAELAVTARTVIDRGDCCRAVHGQPALRAMTVRHWETFRRKPTAAAPQVRLPAPLRGAVPRVRSRRSDPASGGRVTVFGKGITQVMGPALCP